MKAKSQKESEFQSKLVKQIKEEFPGCVVLKNDSSYIQGIPDWIVLYKDKWAVLEAKREEDAKHQPNQDYYVNQLNDMSYSSFVYPENKNEIMKKLHEKFDK